MLYGKKSNVAWYPALFQDRDRTCNFKVISVSPKPKSFS